MRVRINANAAVSLVFRDNTGQALNVGEVEVSITRDDVEVHTDTATFDMSTFIYSFQYVPTELGIYKIKWTAVSSGTIEYDSFESVADDLFSLSELRAVLTSKQFKGTYTNGYLARLRDEVAAEFESVAQRSFVQRRSTAVVPVYGGTAILPSVDVVAVELVNGAAYTGAVLPSGIIETDAEQLATVVYIYGLAEVPDDVRRAAIARAAGLITRDKSGHPDNAETYSSADGGTYKLIIPGRGQYSIGIPAIDVVLNRYKLELKHGVA